MSFRFLKIDFYISVPFAVMLAFLLILDSTGYMSASILAVALHEAGHLVAMKLTHCEPRSVRCCIGGMTIVSNRFTVAKDSIIIALSGPMVNLILAAVLWLIGSYVNNLLILAFAVVQLLVGTVNLLPVKGLDGGTVLSILLQKQTKFNPNLVVTIVSIVTASAVFVLGLAIAVKNVSNPSLLLLGIYLIMINVYRHSF